MSDIFDEVDDILSEVDADLSGGESAPVESEESLDGEKNFNEAELQDIMAEIESLEKEFEAETETEVEPVVEMKAEPVVEPVIKSDLQSEIDRELEMSIMEREEQVKAVPAKAAPVPKVLIMEKKPTSPMPNSEISFEAHGSMNLNLGFKIGEENAKLIIDPVNGLVVSMSGVELCINQEHGCVVTMENGVKFTIPLTSEASSLKKKSA